MKVSQLFEMRPSRPEPKSYFEGIIKVLLWFHDRAGTEEEIEAIFKVGIEMGDGTPNDFPEIDYIMVAQPFEFVGKRFTKGQYIQQEDLAEYAGEDWAIDAGVEAAEEQGQMDQSAFDAGEEDYYDGQREDQRMQGAEQGDFPSEQERYGRQR